jgi:uncharacterized SAM-binding protein YcdF (DUF218 family)
MRRKPILFAISFVLLVLFGWLCGLAWFVSQIPVRANAEPAITDGIVVLTGGELRVDYGIELLAQGKGKKLLISGVGKGVTLDDLYAKTKQSKWIPYFTDHYYITLGHEATNTMENALEAKSWIENEHFKSIRLVTANYHMPRSLYEFRSIMPDIEILPEPVFPTRTEQGIWWENEDSLRVVLIEYHKLLLIILSRLLGL